MNKLVKRILVGTALVGVLACAIMGLTFSKYTNTIIGNGETEVAKWSFKVNDATEEFATIKLADTYDQETLIDGKIAPGVSGSFDLVIDATDAEVGVEYKVDFKDETNKPTNLKFTFDGKTLDEIEDFEEYFTDIINADDTNKVRTLTVNWEWPYETGVADEIAANDEVDTQDGLNASDYTFNVVVTGTQVVPTK